MHLLNPLIERTDVENRREQDGGWYYPSKFFVSCSCGWHEWFGNKDGAENRWIDHIASRNDSAAYSEPFNSGVDGE